jgi:hypothetical protein
MAVMEPSGAKDHIAGLAAHSGFDQVHLGVILLPARSDAHRHMLPLRRQGEITDRILAFAPVRGDDLLGEQRKRVGRNK